MEYPKTYEYMYDRLSNFSARHSFDDFSPNEKREMTCILLSEINNDSLMNDLLVLDKTLMSYMIKLMKEAHLKDSKNGIQKKIWESNAYKLSDDLYFQFYSKLNPLLEEIFEQAVSDYKVFTNKIKLNKGLSAYVTYQVIDENKMIDDHERCVDMNDARRAIYDTRKN